MTTAILSAVRKDLNTPDETKEFRNGRIELVNLDDYRIVRATFKPGWRWSKESSPSLRKEFSHYHLSVYIISGQITVLVEDGTELELTPGTYASFPLSGHDCWVVGTEPCVSIGMLKAESS